VAARCGVRAGRAETLLTPRKAGMRQMPVRSAPMLDAAAMRSRNNNIVEEPIDATLQSRTVGEEQIPAALRSTSNVEAKEPILYDPAYGKLPAQRLLNQWELFAAERRATLESTGTSLIPFPGEAVSGTAAKFSPPLFLCDNNYTVLRVLPSTPGRCKNCGKQNAVCECECDLCKKTPLGWLLVRILTTNDDALDGQPKTIEKVEWQPLCALSRHPIVRAHLMELAAREKSRPVSGRTPRSAPRTPTWATSAPRAVAAAAATGAASAAVSAVSARTPPMVTDAVVRLGDSGSGGAGVCATPVSIRSAAAAAFCFARGCKGCGTHNCGGDRAANS
jgi:hypothetical protein